MLNFRTDFIIRDESDELLAYVDTSEMADNQATADAIVWLYPMRNGRITGARDMADLPARAERAAWEIVRTGAWGK